MFLTSGLLPRTRGAPAWPTWQQTHPAQPWKVIVIVIIIITIINIINIVIIIIITQPLPLPTVIRFKFVDVEAIGESCPKLQRLRLSRILSFCNTHSPRSWFVTPIRHGHDDRNRIYSSWSLQTFFCGNHQKSVFRFPLLNLESLIVLNTKSCRSVIFILLILTMTIN